MVIGSTMMLRETSLMPHIPGLPALLSMLFAPVIELRYVNISKEELGHHWKTMLLLPFCFAAPGNLLHWRPGSGGLGT